MAKAFDVDTGGTLETSLFAWYNHENLTDEFSGGHDLTDLGTLAYNAGKINNAADTGASNSSKSLYHNTTDPGFGPANGPASISMFFNVTTAPGSGVEHILANFQSSVSGGTNDIGYVLKYVNQAGVLKLNFARLREGVVWQNSLYTTTLTVGTWYHIVLTYDGTSVRGYLNNSLVVGPTAYSGNGNIKYGRYIQIFARGGDAGSSVGNCSSGLADMCGFWTKALSSTEIGDLNNSGNGNAYREQAGGGVVLPHPTLLTLGVG